MPIIIKCQILALAIYQSTTTCQKFANRHELAPYENIVFLLLLLTEQQTMQMFTFGWTITLTSNSLQVVHTLLHIVYIHTHGKNIIRIIWATPKLQHNNTPAPLCAIISRNSFNIRVRVSRDHRSICTEEEQAVGYRKLQTSAVKKTA